MKIVQLCPYAMERPGGVQRHVRDLSAWLTAEGHETRIVAPPMPGRPAQVKGALTEIGWARELAVHGTAFEISLAAPWAARRLASELRDWGADIVHMHTPWTPALVGQMSRALRLPTVTTIHATLPSPDGAGVIDRYIHRSAARFLRQSARVVTPSPAPLEMLETLVPDLDTTILPPCVDLSSFEPGTKKPGSLLFLGRLEPRKGVDVLLAAWPMIRAARPEASLTIAGDGPLRDAVVQADNVSFIRAPSDPQILHLLAKTDIFVAPAPYGESYGLTLAEAMSAGAVPIAAANAGYGHILREVPDLLVAPGSVDALADKVIDVLQKDRSGFAQRLTNLGAASDVAQVGHDYLALFETCVVSDSA